MGVIWNIIHMIFPALLNHKNSGNRPYFQLQEPFQPGASSRSQQTSNFTTTTCQNSITNTSLRKKPFRLFDHSWKRRVPRRLLHVMIFRSSCQRCELCCVLELHLPANEDLPDCQAQPLMEFRSCTCKGSGESLKCFQNSNWSWDSSAVWQ